MSDDMHCHVCGTSDVSHVVGVDWDGIISAYTVRAYCDDCLSRTLKRKEVQSMSYDPDEVTIGAELAQRRFIFESEMFDHLKDTNN